MLICNQYLTNLTDFILFIKAIVNIRVCVSVFFPLFLKAKQIQYNIPCENKEPRTVCVCVLPHVCASGIVNV